MIYLFQILMFICCYQQFVCGITSEQEVGTLVVSYNTGEKAERLNRVRFSLVSEEDNTEEMYPKGNAFVECSDSQSRLVVIDHLPVGNYVLRFIIPNTDKLFENIPEHQVTIRKDEIIRFDHSLQPRYATARIRTELLPEDYVPDAAPAITLEDIYGNVRAHSITGKLVAHHLIPGKYVVKFSPLKGYHTPENHSLEITAGQATHQIAGTYIWEGVAETKDIAYSYVQRRPSGAVVINNFNAQLTVTNSQPQARWTLLRNDVSVYEGVGSITNFQVLDGDNYRIVAEPLEGYTVRVSPSSSFRLFVGDTMRVSIAYERNIGSLSLEAPFPLGETLTFTLKSDDMPAATYKVRSSSGKVFWQSQPLPTGEYEVNYILPPNFATAAPERVFVRQGQRVRLAPKFVMRSSLRVIANIPEAIFLLSGFNDSKVWKGEGREHSFMDIPPGLYRLSFSSQDPNYFIAPKEMSVTIKDRESKDINVFYQISGRLTIRTNIDRSQVIIQELGGAQKILRETISNHAKAFNLPEGRYRVTLASLPQDKRSTAIMYPPEPVDVVIRPLASEELNLSFSVNNVVKEKPRKLSVTSGISAGGFSVYKLQDGGRELIGHYSGKSSQVALPAADHFEIVFDDVPNYKTPEGITVDLKAGEERNIVAEYSPFLSLIDIPEGKAIIGDASSQEKINELSAKIVTLSAFSIGMYEITNAEFAAWLNVAIKAGTISYVKEADNRGQVVNLKGDLLFKSFEADPYSQISAQPQSTGVPTFTTLAGKDSYPVINVTWYGAQAYCKDNKCRLPTEAEWEKAAGMEQQTAGGGLKKYRFGFGRDDIDPTWANYRDDADNIQYFKVLTTPVGFYNGVNVLPLSLKSNTQQSTHLAKSPYGAFDMSGNVWEWVNDWYDESYYVNMPERDPQGPTQGTDKVVKGGCYDSLADGVRVTERMGLAPDYCDAYTGFRIAK